MFSECATEDVKLALDEIWRVYGEPVMNLLRLRRIRRGAPEIQHVLAKLYRLSHFAESISSDAEKVQLMSSVNKKWEQIVQLVIKGIHDNPIFIFYICRNRRRKATRKFPPP